MKLDRLKTSPAEYQAISSIPEIYLKVLHTVAVWTTTRTCIKDSLRVKILRVFKQPLLVRD